MFVIYATTPNGLIILGSGLIKTTGYKGTVFDYKNELSEMGFKDGCVFFIAPAPRDYGGPELYMTQETGQWVFVNKDMDPPTPTPDNTIGVEYTHSDPAVIEKAAALGGKTIIDPAYEHLFRDRMTMPLPMIARMFGMGVRELRMRLKTRGVLHAEQRFHGIPTPEYRRYFYTWLGAVETIPHVGKVQTHVTHALPNAIEMIAETIGVQPNLTI